MDFAGKHLHAPEQRMILGATALATQPFIDLHNKDVDEETRMVSVARTIAKIVAGTLVGVGVRYLGIAAVKALTKYSPILNKKGNKVVGLSPERGILVPLFEGINAIKPIKPEKFTEDMNRYIKAIGTTVATVAMIFTNFMLDAPLTKYFTEKFKNVIFKNKNGNQNIESGVKKQ